jgi:hypothetical protein
MHEFLHGKAAERRSFWLLAPTLHYTLVFCTTERFQSVRLTQLAQSNFQVRCYRNPKKEGRCRADTLYRQVKYLNNVIESDHGKLKQLIRPVRGFKTLRTAYATIKGFEVMRALRKGQASAFNLTRDIRGEARIVEWAFGLGASALAEAAQFLNERLQLEAAGPANPTTKSGIHAPSTTLCNRTTNWSFNNEINLFDHHKSGVCSR